MVKRRISLYVIPIPLKFVSRDPVTRSASEQLGKDDSCNDLPTIGAPLQVQEQPIVSGENGSQSWLHAGRSPRFTVRICPDLSPCGVITQQRCGIGICVRSREVMYKRSAKSISGIRVGRSSTRPFQLNDVLSVIIIIGLLHSWARGSQEGVVKT